MKVFNNVFSGGGSNYIDYGELANIGSEELIVVNLPSLPTENFQFNITIGNFNYNVKCNILGYNPNTGGYAITCEFFNSEAGVFGTGGGIKEENGEVTAFIAPV